MPRLRSLTLFVAFTAGCALAATSACSSGAPQSAPAPAEHALSGLAAQHVAVLPTYFIRLAPELKWSIGRPIELQRTMDAEIASAFDERGLKKTWVFPEELSQAYHRNSTYAADPYTLAEEPLRSPALAIDARLPEPLASQVRTLVALHDDMRLILAPVELRLEPAGGKRGRGVLRVVLLDARFSNVRWIGEISSDSLESFGPAIPAAIAQRLAGVVSPR